MRKRIYLGKKDFVAARSASDPEGNVVNAEGYTIRIIDAKKCPVAIAIRRALAGTGWDVGAVTGNLVAFEHEDGRRTWETLPMIAVAATMVYDSGGEPEPCRFPMDLPD